MGVLGSVTNSIQDISRNIAKSKAGQFAGLYLKQSDEELAAVARKGMLKKETPSKYFTRESIEEARKSSPLFANGNQEYINATERLMKSAGARDMDKANEIAADISTKYNEDRYLNLMAESRAKSEEGIKILNEGSNDDIQFEFERNVKMPGIVNNFADQNDIHKIQRKAYQLNGKKGYFTSADPKTNRIRAGVAAGGYMGVMATARLASGGSLTKNEYGEQDIAGIPFL